MWDISVICVSSCFTLDIPERGSSYNRLEFALLIMRKVNYFLPPFSLKVVKTLQLARCDAFQPSMLWTVCLSRRWPILPNLLGTEVSARVSWTNSEGGIVKYSVYFPSTHTFIHKLHWNRCYTRRYNMAEDIGTTL